MATSGTREGAATMADDTNGQSIPATPAGWRAGTKQSRHDVMSEMKKVSWPGRSEVINTTIIVLIAIFFFAAYLFLADIVFSYVISGIEWAAKQILG